MAEITSVLQDIVETLEDNLDAPEWMLKELAERGRSVLEEART